MNKAQARRSKKHQGYYERYFAKLSHKKALKKVDREKRIKAAQLKRQSRPGQKKPTTIESNT